MRARKPRVILTCGANTYSAPEERIIEFSFEDGTGGLISFRQPSPDAGLGEHLGRVEIYRTEGKVLIVAPATVKAVATR